MAQVPVTVFICIACRNGEAGVERPGRVLFETVAATLGNRADCDVAITPVECLSVCKRPCTVALTAAGKWTYVVGDLDQHHNAGDVVSMASRYAATADGIVPWRERPVSFRKGMVSRVPPLGFAPERR